MASPAGRPRVEFVASYIHFLESEAHEAIEGVGKNGRNVVASSPSHRTTVQAVPFGQAVAPTGAVYEWR